jgi:hypothetical protein
MQLLFYLVTLLTIGVAMKLFGNPPISRAAAVAVVGLLLAVPALMPDRAYAGVANKVYRPVVVPGETEVELRGGYVKDSDPAINTSQAYVVDLGYGFTPNWFSELVLEAAKGPGENLKSEAVEWENILRFTEPGQYFADFGWFAEFRIPLVSGDPYAIETGPLIEQTVGRLVNTLDLLGERTFGGDGDDQTEVSYRLQTRYLSGARIELGLQAFGEKASGEKAAHRIGPAAFSQMRMGQRNKIRMDAAILKGLTAATEDLRARWTVEFEFY